MHGIMFHHFHSPKHQIRPGSLSAGDFESLLDAVNSRFTIVSPEEFGDLLGNYSQNSAVVMLTFDDSLKSQFDVARPILRARGISAGFAIYSSIYEGEPDPLEIFAAFREKNFHDSLDFWNVFSKAVARNFRDVRNDAEGGVAKGFLRDYPFYSHEERLFRFVRDEILSVEQYQGVMWELVDMDPSFDASYVSENLWMNENELKILVSEGHSIGLHSHTHPTRMDLLSGSEQLREYSQNYAWIEENLSVSPEFVAHPCGRYSKQTFAVMEALGVGFGFRSSMTEQFNRSAYEIPREDASNILRELDEFESSV